MAVAVLDINRASNYAARYNPDTEAADLLRDLRDRKMSITTEMNRFNTLCDRWDNLYYPNDVTQGGPDHWAQDKSATEKGGTHVSLNVYPVYVDIPASLQSRPPIENMVPTMLGPGGAHLASLSERLYFAWAFEEDWDLKFHLACVVKGLYGRTAAKVTWDDDLKRPCVSIIDQPRNLYLGWSSSNYRRLDWAIYCYKMTVENVYAEYGLSYDTVTEESSGQRFPYITNPATGPAFTRTWLQPSEMEVEVYDYWYREPKPGATATEGKPVEHETWNAIFVGNYLLHKQMHPEYKGKMPYVPLFNSFIPGLPDGRSEFYDIEQLIAEKDARITQGAKLISRTVRGQFWQLTGQEAPDVVPTGLKPKPDEVVAPGAGNRIEKIEPWMPEFQLEQYLQRIDRELADASGLNDLLRGLSPSAVLSSSKAIAALVANYEARIQLKRDLLYKWRREVWELSAQVWTDKVKPLEPLLGGTVARLKIESPSLTPRDDMEMATIARNLVDGKLWSMVRGMDHVNVDDPEAEQGIIREEQTDATLNPAAVEVMAQLLAVLASQGITPSQGATGMAQGAANALGSGLNRAQQGQPQLNAPAEQGMMPPDQLPPNAPGSPVVGGPPPPGAPPGNGPVPPAGPEPAPGGGGPANQLTSQQMIQGGKVRNRIMATQPIQGGRGSPPPRGG